MEQSPVAMASAYRSRLYGLSRAGRFSAELDKPGSQHTDENDNQRIQRELVLHSRMGDVVHQRVAKQHEYKRNYEFPSESIGATHPGQHEHGQHRTKANVGKRKGFARQVVRAQRPETSQ